MNSPLSPHHSLEDILKQLEERFSIDSPKSSHTNKKKKFKIDFTRFTQNQVIAGLTLVLLLVGAAAGVYLGSQDQDTRENAAVDEPDLYPTATRIASTVAPTKTNTPVVFPTVDWGALTVTPGNGGGDGEGGGEDTIICTDAYGFDGNDGSGCLGKAPGASCGSVLQPAKCSKVQSPFGNATGLCACLEQPTPTPAIDMGCSTKPGGGICVAPGSSCPAGRIQSGLCSGAGSGPICCIPIVVNTSTIRPSNTIIPTNIPATIVPTNIPATIAPTTINWPTTAPTTIIQSTIAPSKTPTKSPTSGPTSTGTISPTNTQLIGPVCANVSMQNVTAATIDTPPLIGHNVTLRCAQVAGANRYEFRMKFPDGSMFEPLSSATMTVSQQFPITMSGTHAALCRPCNNTLCSPWEM